VTTPNVEQVFGAVYDPTTKTLKTSPESRTAGGTLRITAGPPSAGQTARKYTGKVATVTTGTTPVALFTVTAAKTFYVTDVYLATDQTTPMDVQLQAAAAAILNCGVSTTQPVNLTGIDTQPTASAGQAVQLLLPQTTAVQNLWYYIAGYEQ
jgi:endonuclease YncB( thermonuclease family)